MHLKQWEWFYAVKQSNRLIKRDYEATILIHVVFQHIERLTSCQYFNKWKKLFFPSKHGQFSLCPGDRQQNAFQVGNVSNPIFMDKMTLGSDQRFELWTAVHFWTGKTDDILTPIMCFALRGSHNKKKYWKKMLQQNETNTHALLAS